MKRAALLMGLISLMWLVNACSGGDDGNTNPEAGPLTIQLLWAEPATGASPLRVVFTTNITGGIEPYYYSWDFTNDGSVDTYLNGEFRRTVSVDSNYYWRASDVNGVSIYNAVLTVTDSVGEVVTSDPIQVNVMGTTGVTVDAETWSDEPTVDPETGGLEYVYRSGLPVYFRATASEGTAPYSYHWDFDNDGMTDSTVPSPQHTYTYTGKGSRAYIWNLEVVDVNGERVYFSNYVEVMGEDIGGDTNPPFSILVNSTPSRDDDGTIRIIFDPTGGNVNVPSEPQLDLAVVVDQNSGGGIPPFEYYWDFENDGSLDSQVLSPTIPYYDSERKILINPYLHDESVKNFTLECVVIDSTGRLESVQIPVEVSRWAGLDPIQVDYAYGIAVAGNLPANPRPYAQVQTQNSITTVVFDFKISGSTGIFEYQFDGDGDGNAEEIDLNSDGAVDPMDSGWYDVPAGAIAKSGEFTITLGYQGVGYFPTHINVRSVDNSGNATSTKRFELPISLVKREELTEYDQISGVVAFDFGVPESRRDHSISADWTIQTHAANGQTLAEREIIIAGGRRGTAVLNTVDRVLQTYTPPSDLGKIEDLAGSEVTDRAPLNQERFSSVMWTEGPENGSGATIRIHGGRNERNGMLVSAERSTGGSNPWTIMNEILIPEYYPLMEMAGTYVPGTGYVMAGGLNQPAEEDNAQASRKLLSYDTVFDAYGQLTEMSSGRYDAGIAATNGRIYVIGGREANGGSVATVEAYDPVTRQWDTFAPSMLEARSGAAVQVVGGMVYVIGGAYWPPNESEPILLDTAEVFNPMTGVWSHTVPLSDPNQSDAVLMANGLASTVAPGPGGVNASGAVANTIICFGGEGIDEEAGVDMGELSRMYEFTYFYTVELVEE